MLTKDTVHSYKLMQSIDLHRSALRPAGGDPEIDRPQKKFFDGLCFFEWPWPFWTPLKAFREKAVWFKQRKTRRKVALFLTPLGAARAARSADWVKIDMWENPSFDSSGSRQLVGTLPCALSLSRSPLTCTSTHLRVSLVSPLHAHRWACYWKWSSRQPYKFCSISDPPPPSPFSLSLSLSLSLHVTRFEKKNHFR